MPEIKLVDSRLKRAIYLILGFVFVSLGIIGAFLPIMPTTIFLILATWFFMRSSEKYYIWLTSNKYFGKLIKNYYTFRGIEAKARTKSLIILWITLLVPMIFLKIWWATLISICVGIGVTWHLFALKTLTENEIRDLESEFKEKEDYK
ncbi:MAG TPA: YbaN family protein [Candidatus Kapabacteria bacterium]|nr:YbaN family protein [Candidatus Kapabacteria bacterium]